MPFGFGDGGFDGMLKKAAASAKVMARDAVKGSSTLVAKVSETDVKSTAKRFTNKVMERAEGAGFALVEELPEVESAMLNLKASDAAYRELLAVLKEALVAQQRAVHRQVRVANRAEVLGRDLEAPPVGTALCALAAHLVEAADHAAALHAIKDGAEVEEQAQDDFPLRVYDSPGARLVGAVEGFVREELAQALAARTSYRDARREVSLVARKAGELQAKLDAA
eukprot:CAMPEP_0181310182 /NCGR_PEP_ID=MMETSP1101-20121128/12448_1 /TAXON_ID=46948 /ORGANISM="Rhodomonas abbreviata, Strain Caron Lab Isolate" /LENGTH=223 /DNA_ID=CAMNT_0023416791 /DNA_START=184 /DNA_END=852 /DNA_ORIENTATION=-